MSSNVTLKRETVFSSDRRYRYTLWRTWSLPIKTDLFVSQPEPVTDSAKFVQFICLNPSTADESVNDPTVRRCISFAKSWGYPALCMTNLFAWRATDPSALRALDDPVGLDNADWIYRVASEAEIIMCAWGVYGLHQGQGQKYLDKLRKFFPDKLRCIKLTANGYPSHPLYLLSHLKPIPL